MKVIGTKDLQMKEYLEIYTHTFSTLTELTVQEAREKAIAQIAQIVRLDTLKEVLATIKADADPFLDSAILSKVERLIETTSKQ